MSNVIPSNSSRTDLLEFTYPERARSVKLTDHFGTQIVGESIAGSYLGHMLSVIHPLGGALFGAVHVIAETAVSWVLERAKLFQASDTCSVIMRWALCFFSGIAAASFVASSLGFSITLSVSIAFGAAISGVTVLGKLLMRSLSAT